MKTKRRFFITLSLTLACCMPALAGDAPDDLASLSLEDLMKVEVTSVSRQRQSVAQAPAAITVITSEEIRRSGLTSIPELLRLVPGMDVARLDANKWVIGSRGNFGQTYAQDQLVLFDGRSVYTPFFGGVFWETQDYILQDLDRIEAIRGPGATLWGSNAVNGVINITSKSSRDTQGWLLTGTGGNIDGQGAIRYGGKIDDSTFYRVYTKYSQTPHLESADDRWDSLRGGFRIDRYSTPKDQLTLQGDIYSVHLHETDSFASPAPPFLAQSPNSLYSSGGNILGRWTHTFNEKSDMALQVYYDRMERETLADLSMDTVDLDFQHRFSPAANHEIIWGFDVRVMSDHIEQTSPITLADPDRRTNSIYSAYAQDTWAFVPDRWALTAGSKVEWNNYTHFEIEPSVRLLYTPNHDNSFWGAISRAAHVPSRWEEDVHTAGITERAGPGGVPVFVNTNGNQDSQSEILMAYELGWRTQLTKSLSFDVTGYFNQYSHIDSFEPGPPSFAPTPFPHLNLPLNIANNIAGNVFGLELAVNYRVTPTWRLNGSYTFTEIQLHTLGQDVAEEHTYEGTAPHNQFQIHSYWDITRDVEFNAHLYYVDNLTVHGLGNGTPAYIRTDLGIVWRPRKNLEIALYGQNLLDNSHFESSGYGFNVSSPVPRSVVLQVSLTF